MSQVPKLPERQELSRIYLKQRQSLSIDAKVLMSNLRIDAWYEHWDGMVYVSLSGKDSWTLLNLVWKRHPDVPAVFSNTGLEYPEIVQFVRRLREQYPHRITIVQPKRTFRQVLDAQGYPVVSKKVSRQLRILGQESGNPRWAKTYQLYDTGIKQDGTYSKNSQLADRWRYLLKSGFRFSELCCDLLKKEPLDTYAKMTGRKRMTGIMAAEGGQRDKPRHCNIFDGSDPNSAPMFFWTEQDVWVYIKGNNLPYAKIYDLGEKRTGCMYCMFGAHCEKSPNRFQRMKAHHPVQWNYCTERLGIGDVLDLLGVPWGKDVKPKRVTVGKPVAQSSPGNR